MWVAYRPRLRSVIPPEGPPGPGVVVLLSARSGGARASRGLAGRCVCLRERRGSHPFWLLGLPPAHLALLRKCLDPWTRVLCTAAQARSGPLQPGQVTYRCSHPPGFGAVSCGWIPPGGSRSLSRLSILVPQFPLGFHPQLSPPLTATQYVASSAVSALISIPLPLCLALLSSSRPTPRVRGAGGWWYRAVKMIYFH